MTEVTAHQIAKRTAEYMNLPAVQAAQEEYNRWMTVAMAENENLCDLEKLEEVQKFAEEAALALFEWKTRMEEDMGEKHIAELRKHFEDSYAEFVNTVEQNISIKEVEEERPLLLAEQAAKDEYEERMSSMRSPEDISSMESLQPLQQDAVEAAMLIFEAMMGGHSREALQRYFQTRYQEYERTVALNIRMEEARRLAEERSQLSFTERENRRIRQEDEYDCIADVEITNSTPHYFAYKDIAMYKGVVSQPPTNIGPDETLRFSCHKTKWAVNGCAGSVRWEYTVDNKAYGMTLSFITIYKTPLCHESNSVGLKLTNENGSVISDSQMGTASLANRLISVAATTGNSNHTTIRVTISESA